MKLPPPIASFAWRQPPSAGITSPTTGMITPSTIPLTTLPIAAPTTTPAARATTFCFSRNSRKSFANPRAERPIPTGMSAMAGPSSGRAAARGRPQGSPRSGPLDPVRQAAHGLEQLAHVERLEQRRVGAEQAPHVRGLDARRHHHRDARERRVSPQLGEDGRTVETGEQQVEHEDVGRRGADRSQRGDPVRRHLDGIPLAREDVREDVPLEVVVVDDEDARGMGHDPRTVGDSISPDERPGPAGSSPPYPVRPARASAMISRRPSTTRSAPARSSAARSQTPQVTPIARTPAARAAAMS